MDKETLKDIRYPACRHGFVTVRVVRGCLGQANKTGRETTPLVQTGCIFRRALRNFNSCKELHQIKALGTRHSFNGIADSTQNQVSLKNFNQIALDRKSRTVTVGAGVRYGQLSPYLYENGYALHNLASLPHISVVGACATATHGSGSHNGNLATPVSAMEIVTADGGVLVLTRDRDGERFDGSVVDLGGVGVVTKLTLDVQPTFDVAQLCTRT